MRKMHFKTLSIQTKLWFLTSVLVMITILSVTLVVSSITTNFITNEAERDLSKNIEQLSEKINLVFNETAVFSKMAISNKEVQDFSNQAKIGSFSEEEDIRRILTSFVVPRTYIEKMHLYLKPSELYYSSNYYLETSSSFKDHVEEIEAILNPVHTSIWGMPFFSTELEQYVFPYYRKIYFGKSGVELGLIESLVPVRLFISTIENSVLSEIGNLYLIDDEGTIIVHNDKDMILEKVEPSWLKFIKDNLNTTSIYNQTILCSSKVVPTTGWIIVNEVPQTLILGTAHDMKFKFLFIGIIALICTVFISFRLSILFTKPLREMETSITAMENLDSKKYVKVYSMDEIGKLGKQYNHMIDRLAQSAELGKKREVRIKEYELSLLQSQINPHFLNNTLENICGLIELGRRDDSISLIGDTADFYRSILSTNNLIIDLRQELNIAELFVKIQKIRSNKIIDFEIDVAEKYMDKQIIKLTLQPLIENAIRHGMDYSCEKLKILVTSVETHNELIISIKDSGLGMDREVVESILKTEPKTIDGRIRHVGVFATNQRLKLHFGKQYGLRYISEKNKGTTVEIHLPREVEDEEIR
jgi:two-component system, sensor histidine kinase YesM